MRTNILGFTAEQASRLSGVTVDQLRHWDETEFFVPSVERQDGKPFGRIYSFRDVVGLRVLDRLRNKHKVPLQALRRVGRWLSSLPDIDWANAILYVAGSTVYFEDPRTGQVHSGKTLPQTVFPIALSTISEEVRRGAETLQRRSQESVGRITRNRNVVSNAPVIAETRIPTAAIKRFVDAGYSVDQIIQEYPSLTKADVQAAIQYESARQIPVAG